VIDPRVNAQVTLLSSSPMSPDAFYETFLSILEVYNFAALDRGDSIMIVPDADVRQRAGIEVGAQNVVTQTMVLENVGAAQIVPIIRPMMPQSAHLAAHQPSNMLIMFDREENVQRMMRIVRRMDQAGSEDVEAVKRALAADPEETAIPPQ
jgi:general secretion pathway protein D